MRLHHCVEQHALGLEHAPTRLNTLPGAPATPADPIALMVAVAASRDESSADRYRCARAPEPLRACRQRSLRGRAERRIRQARRQATTQPERRSGRRDIAYELLPLAPPALRGGTGHPTRGCEDLAAPPPELLDAAESARAQRSSTHLGVTRKLLECETVWGLCFCVVGRSRTRLSALHRAGCRHCHLGSPFMDTGRRFPS